MKILVTGGAGFIGSHVVDRYVTLGDEVVVLDNLSHGRPENVNKRARLVQLDVRDPAVENLFATEKFDVVNHHAAQMNVRKSVEDPVFDAEVNILGSLKLIRYSIRYGVQRFIFASTGGAIYGEPKKLPVSEEDPKNPISPYGLAKFTVEQYLFLHYMNSRLEYVALRYGNVYGPRQDPEGEAGVIAIFIDQLKQGKAPHIYGDGEQLRDYVYVEDVAEANMRALLVDLKALEEVGQTNVDTYAFHIATGRGVSVNAIFKELRKLSGAKVSATFDPPREGEVRRIYSSISKAEKYLAWKPKTLLEEGLKKTANAFGVV